MLRCVSNTYINNPLTSQSWPWEFFWRWHHPQPTDQHIRVARFLQATRRYLRNSFQLSVVYWAVRGRLSPRYHMLCSALSFRDQYRSMFSFLTDRHHVKAEMNVFPICLFCWRLEFVSRFRIVCIGALSLAGARSMRGLYHNPRRIRDPSLVHQRRCLRSVCSVQSCHCG